MSDRGLRNPDRADIEDRADRAALLEGAEAHPDVVAPSVSLSGILTSTRRTRPGSSLRQKPSCTPNALVIGWILGSRRIDCEPGSLSSIYTA
jgi:hypothetical protein